MRQGTTAVVYKGKIYPLETLRQDAPADLLSILEERGWLAPVSAEDGQGGEEEMAEQVFNWEGARYTLETLPEAPRELHLLLKERGELPDGIEPPALELEDVAGVGSDTAEGLRANGIDSVQALAAAEEADLVAVSGIGPKTAPKLIEAAKALQE